MQIISGFVKEIDFQRCNRCISDTSIPGITFDTNGECSICKFHDHLSNIYPENENSIKVLEKKIQKIKDEGKGKKYDCIVGISGGRDSIYLLYLTVREFGLRPLAVHFNDGFDNPTAGENMLHAVRILGVDLRTITSDFRECKDLKVVDLKASTPLLNNGTDVGIGAALYSVAYKEKIKTIFYGQSFRTEGIRPIAWAYFDGDHLRALHKRFGKYPLRKWKPDDAGYNLGIKEMFYYAIICRIKTFAPFYYYPYNRKVAEEIITKELNWIYPGGHYFDDLYWSMITMIHRRKFNIDFRKIAYSALIRSGQMDRLFALNAIEQKYVMEDEKIIQLCIKRLGISKDEFKEYLAMPAKNFWDYPNSYRILRLFKYPIWIACKLGIFTSVVYEKYFTLPYK